MSQTYAEPIAGTERLRALRDSGLLDTPAEEAFDRLTRLAARLLHTPAAAISLVDEDRVYFKSAVGLPQPWAETREAPLARSFCGHVAATGEPLALPDTRSDPRFREAPAAAEMGMGAYLGVPLATRNGHVFGAFCVADAAAREWTEEDLATLQELSAIAATEIALQQEIARRRRVEEALRGRDAWTHGGLRAGGIDVWDLDLRTQLIRWSDGQDGPLADFGEANHAELMALIHPDDRPGVDAAIRRVVCEGGDFEARFRVLCGGEGVRWREIHGRLLRDASGAPARLVGAGRDVTERKEAEDALALQRELLKTILDHIPVMIAVFEPDGRLGYVNRAWEQTTGWTFEEARRRDIIAEFYPEPEERARVVEFIQAAGGCWKDFRTRVRDGRIVDSSWANIRLSDGRSIGIGQDVTKRKQAEQALRQSEEQIRHMQKMEAVGRLAGGVAHDFNNMLAVINGYSDLLLSTLNPGHPAAGPIQEIRAAGERAARVTRQLLIFSRKQLLTPKVLNLNEVVAGTDKMLRRLIGEDIELVTLFEPELGRVRVDPGQFEQVLLNLAVNARDAMPQGGKLILRTANVDRSAFQVRKEPAAHPGHYVMVEVIDTGIGMDAATLEHIFEPFFTTKGYGKGTGLGLATVHGIVHQSGGYVEVHSVPDEGTAFRIYLPRVDEPAEPQQRDGSRSLPTGAETILLCEDEEMVRGMVAQALRNSGYTVLEAMHGAEALRIAARHTAPIDLLLTDVVMPGGMNGRELAERVAEIRPGTRVMLMSGYLDDAATHWGSQDPRPAFLEKPFTPSALALKVREVLDGSVAARPEEGCSPSGLRLVP